MAMPVAAVNKDDLPERRENKVRLTRKIGLMQPKRDLERTRNSPHEKFGPGVLRLNQRHPFAALDPGQGVHYVSALARMVPNKESAQTRKRKAKLWKIYNFRCRAGKG